VSAEQSTEGVTVQRLNVADVDGDSVTFRAWPDGMILLTPRLRANGEPSSVTITPEDGLALLSFLADALGVERYIPEVTS